MNVRLLILACLFATGCLPTSTPISTVADNESVSDPSGRRFVAKAWEVLGDDSPLRDRAELDRLAAKSKSDVVDELMTRSAFEQSMMRMTKYFFGYRDGGSSRFGISERHPQMIVAARSVNHGDNYFDIFDFDLKRFAEIRPMDPTRVEAADQALRVYQAEIEGLRAIEGQEMSYEDCAAKLKPIAGMSNTFEGATSSLRVFGLQPNEPLNQLIRHVWRRAYFAGVDGRFQTDGPFDFPSSTPVDPDEDGGGDDEDDDVDVVIDDGDDDDDSGWDDDRSNDGPRVCAKAGTADLVVELTKVLRDNQQKLADLDAVAAKEGFGRFIQSDAPGDGEFDFPDDGDISRGEPAAPYFDWFRMANSSTNFNRRRAAYLLKTFMCDDLDLQGIDIEPSEHAEGAHATDPSCQTCHYKLDPMAGLMRNIGSAGRNFANVDNLIFDDGALLEGSRKQDYLNTWHGNSGWNVGYFVSPGRPARGSQGTDLKSFLKFASNYERTQMCLTRRMFEFYVGTDQAVDGAWLADVKRTVAPRHGSAGIRQAIKKIVLSDAFMVADPEPAACYDLAPGADPDARPDCSIAYVVEKNCGGCHGDGHSSLRVSQWVDNPLPDGRAFKSFVHLDSDDNQLSAQESYETILDRLTEAETGSEMPPGEIDLKERERLINWVKKQLEKIEQGGGA